MKRRRMAITGAILILAVATALIVPRWRAARNRRRIWQTMSDIYSLGAALNQFAMANAGLFPSPAPIDPDVVSWQALMPDHLSNATYPTRGAEWLRPHLQRFFNRPMPTKDAWGGPILAAVSRDRRVYTLVSLGSDGKKDASVMYAYPPAEPWHDLIFLDGSFISAPDGVTH